MPLINIVIVLVVRAVGLWLINNYIPMAGSIKTILNVVVVVAVAVWVLQALGLWARVTSYKFVNWAGSCELAPERVEHEPAGAVASRYSHLRSATAQLYCKSHQFFRGNLLEWKAEARLPRISGIG